MSRDSIVDGDWLHVTARVIKYDTIAIELRTSHKMGVGCLYGAHTTQGKDF